MTRETMRAALAGGTVVVVGWLALLAVTASRDPGLALNLLAQAVAHATLGRETGIPTGLAFETPWPVVALAVALQDAAILLVGYGLAMIVLLRAERFPRFHALVTRTETALSGFAHKTEMVGVAFLAFFLWIPFFPGGALTAALVGRAAGYRPRVLLPALLVSLVAAAFINTALYAGLGSLLGPNGRWIVAGAALAITATIVLVGLLRKRFGARDPTAAGGPAPPGDLPPGPRP